jgi:alkylhydroperoxidase family enzyme
MRVPYAPKEPPTEADAPVYQRISERRAPRPLIPLDLALLHNTAIADGWNSFIGAVRTKNSLPADIKELAISRIAALNNAVHEWNSHGPLTLKAGITKEGMETARTAPALEKGAGEKVREGGGLGKREWAILDFTDQSTRNVEVDDTVFERVKEHLSEKETVELAVTVAAYNCVSRFLVALDVGEDRGKEFLSVDELAKQ